MENLNLIQISYQEEDICNTSFIGITTQDEIGWIEGIVSQPDSGDKYFVYGKHEELHTVIEFSLYHNDDSFHSTVIYGCEGINKNSAHLYWHQIVNNEIVEENVNPCRIVFSDPEQVCEISQQVKDRFKTELEIVKSHIHPTSKKRYKWLNKDFHKKNYSLTRTKK